MIYHNNTLQNYQPDKQPDYQLRADSSSIRREAPTSNIARLDAARVHPENPRESLDVPHIRRKLKVRRYEGHFSEQKARASRDANLAAKIASDWFNTTKKKSCCQRPVVETFAGGAEAELLRRCGRCLEARVAALPPNVPRIRPAAIIALILISSGPCTPALLPNDGGYSTSS